MNEEGTNLHLTEATSKLTSTGAVVLTGAPGSGKTYLARQVAENMPVVVVDESFYLEKTNGNLYETLATLHENRTPIIITAQKVSAALQNFIDTVKAAVIPLHR